MSKKLWDWFYLKPVDHLDILRSENIDKGRKMHEAVSKRIKELIGSGPNLKFVGQTTPICFEHFIDDFKKVVECDCEVKILKNRIDPKTKINSIWSKDLIISDVLIKQNSNKPSQVSICSSCNYYNEWIPFDPDYICYKCKKGW